MGEVGVPPALEAAVESLREAVVAGRTDIVRRLLDTCDSCDGGGTEERKQLINSHCAEDGGTFLHLATQLGHRDIVRALLSGGGDPGVINTKGNTAPQVATTPAVCAVYTEELLRATAQSDLGRVCQLLAGGLSVNSYDNSVSRNTPLHWAASFADTDTLRCLIARGADVHSVNSHGASPLHDAVARGEEHIVTALLQHGAVPHVQRCSGGRHKGKTALEMASEKGGAVLTALEKHNNSSGAPGEGSSPLLTRKRRADTLDMRGLAGSLESLNSIGGDSLLLTGIASSRPVHDASTGLTRAAEANNIISVHHHNGGGRKSLDMGSFLAGKGNKIVNVDESISEDPPNITKIVGSVEERYTNGYANHAVQGTAGNGEESPGSNTIKSSSVNKGVVAYVDGSLLSRSKSVPFSRSPLHSASSLDFSPGMDQVYERLAGGCVVPPSPLVTSAPLHLLWPQPRHMMQTPDDSWCVPRVLTLAVVPGPVSLHSVVEVVEVHRSSLESCGGVEVRVVGAVSRLHTSHSASVLITILSASHAASSQHYRLTVTTTGVRLSCGSLESLHYALTTLAQLLLVHTSDAKSNPTCASKAAPLLLSKTSVHSDNTNNPPSSATLSRSLSSESTVLSLDTTAARSNAASSTLSTALQIGCVVIADVPDVPHRAFMLDAAPLARIPTLSTMYQMIDSILSFKLNQLHLMMRLQHVTTIDTNGAYYSSVNAQVDASTNASSDFSALKSKHTSTCFCPLPYDTSELVALSRYCQSRGITLVPGFDLDHSWNTGRAESLSLLEITSAVANALTHFNDTTFVNIGPGLTSVLASSVIAEKGINNPWECLGIPANASLIICANVLKDVSAQRVPLGALFMEYGFQVNHDFSTAQETAMKNGRPHAVCTGTAAWSSLAGFPEASTYNIHEGVVEKHGTGDNLFCNSRSVVVVAHWSTPASLTPLVFTWPAILVCAGLAWNGRTHFDYVNSSIGLLIDTHLVRVSDCGFGKALIELGRCETWLTREMRGQSSNNLANLPPASTGPGSTLHQLLTDPDSVVLEHLSSEKFGSVLRHIKRSIRNIVNNRVVSSLWPLMPVAAAELNLSADLMMTSCRLGRALVTVGSNPHSNLGMAVVNPGLTHLPPTLRTDVANRLLSLRESYSCLWLHCHKSPGLQASLLLLSSLLSRLLPQHDNIQNL